MALKNQPLTVTYSAWSASTGAPASGDVANHTLKLIQDGVEGAPTNAPSADDAARPGVYTLALTATDMDYNAVTVCGVSSTANVYIVPVQVVTERGVLPTVAPATSGGLPTVGTGAGQLNPSGTGKIPATLASSDVSGNLAANVTQVGGSNIPAPAVSGVLPVDVHYQDGVADTATAQGGTSTTITLATAEAAVDDYFKDQYVAIVGGTGAGQARLVTGYVGSTRVATVDSAWATAPDGTSTYSIGGYAVVAGGGGNVTVGGYATGQDPATYVLATPANRLATDGSGAVTVGAVATGTITSAAFATGAIAASAVAADALDNIKTLTAGINLPQGVALALAVLSSVRTGVPASGSGGTATIKDPTGTTTLATITVDATGNITGVTYSPPSV